MLPQQLLQGQTLAVLAITSTKRVQIVLGMASSQIGRTAGTDIMPAAGGLLPESQESSTDRWVRDGVPAEEAAGMS